MGKVDYNKQNNSHKMGALPSKIDLRDYTYNPYISMAAAPLPEKFELWTPKVKDQGTVGSCVAHTAAEIEEYFNHKEGKKYTPLSVGYIYGCRYEYKGEGMYLRDALKTLTNRGICEYNEFTHNKEVPEIITLFQEADKTGWNTDKNHKISTYFSITGNKEEIINKVKKCLMDNGPVMMAVPWYSDFKVKNGMIYSPSDCKTSEGGHCIYLYGWNEKGWLIQNSWGKLWGNGGRAIYPYDYPVREFWGVTDTINFDIKKKDYNKILNFIIKLLNSILNSLKGLDSFIK